MIKRIYIDNYKCLVNFELDLRETVLLLGASGSGKTAVLDVVYAVRKLLAGDIRVNDRLAFHRSTLTSWQTRRAQVIEFDVDVAGCYFRYRLEIEHEDDADKVIIAKESLVGDGRRLFSFDRGTVQLYRDDGSEGPSYGADWRESALARVVERPGVNNRLTAFKDAISEVVVCGITPTHLRAVSSGEEPRVDRHAENFVDWYRSASVEDPRSVAGLLEALTEAIDGFRNATLKPAGPEAKVFTLDFATGGNPYRLSFDQLSDGQRALIVLYAFLHVGGPQRGIILFLDEPDNYVPLSEIQPWLLHLIELCEDTPSQAVVCSHHPEMIDYLGPDRGLMLRREESGVTTVRPVTELAPDNGLRLSESIAHGWI